LKLKIDDGTNSAAEAIVVDLMNVRLVVMIIFLSLEKFCLADFYQENATGIAGLFVDPVIGRICNAKGRLIFV